MLQFDSYTTASKWTNILDIGIYCCQQVSHYKQSRLRLLHWKSLSLDGRRHWQFKIVFGQQPNLFPVHSQWMTAIFHSWFLFDTHQQTLSHTHTHTHTYIHTLSCPPYLSVSVTASLSLSFSHSLFIYISLAPALKSYVFLTDGT